MTFGREGYRSPSQIANAVAPPEQKVRDDARLSALSHRSMLYAFSRFALDEPDPRLRRRLTDDARKFQQMAEECEALAASPIPEKPARACRRRQSQGVAQMQARSLMLAD